MGVDFCPHYGIGLLLGPVVSPLRKRSSEVWTIFISLASACTSCTMTSTRTATHHSCRVSLLRLLRRRRRLTGLSWTRRSGLKLCRTCSGLRFPDLEEEWTSDAVSDLEEEWLDTLPDLEEEEWPHALVDLEERESADSVADFDEESGDAVSVAFER